MKVVCNDCSMGESTPKDSQISLNACKIRTPRLLCCPIIRPMNSERRWQKNTRIPKPKDCCRKTNGASFRKSATKLLDRDRLRQIPGLIHVVAQVTSHMVRHQLQRNDGKNRIHRPVRFWQRQVVLTDI